MRFEESHTEPLSSPHFDDERTLLAAKPVVPLSEIPSIARTRSRFRRHVVLATLAVLSILALAGTVSRFRNERSEPLLNSQAGVASQAPANMADGGIVKPAPATARKPAARTAEKVTVKRKTRATTPEPVAVAIVQPEPEPEPEDMQTREEILREARRMQRQARRERWYRRQAEDDIFRINDIFEGRRRRP